MRFQPDLLAGKVVVVTGGTAGIGAGIAAALGRLGACVVRQDAAPMPSQRQRASTWRHRSWMSRTSPVWRRVSMAWSG